jgi:uncharacterized protein (DUF983 family)
MYLNKNPFKLTSTLKMHEKCSYCGLTYQIEPSFFYGAMYVSYGLNVAIGIATFLISYLIFHTSLKIAFVAIIVALILLFPYVLRWARNIYINMFVTFDPNWEKE